MSDSFASTLSSSSSGSTVSHASTASSDSTASHASHEPHLSSSHHLAGHASNGAETKKEPSDSYKVAFLKHFHDTDRRKKSLDVVKKYVDPKAIASKMKMFWIFLVIMCCFNVYYFFLGPGARNCHTSLCTLAKGMTIAIAVGCVLVGILYFFRADSKKLRRLRRSMLSAPRSGLDAALEVGNALSHAGTPFGKVNDQGQYEFSLHEGMIPHLLSRTADKLTESSFKTDSSGHNAAIVSRARDWKIQHDLHTMNDNDITNQTFYPNDFKAA